ncbi:MAG TPA: ATP-binding protein [Hyphomonadaceae bacterium]|nr:ATP-binding protein [Hyphomonadaceae bacterium]
MSRKNMMQAAVLSLLILAAALSLDFVLNGILFPDPGGYAPWSTMFITLAVAPPFTSFLIYQHARVQKVQAALDAERAQRLAEVEAARDIAENATRAKSEFLANMSHEIRTPLNGVLGMTQALEHRELDPEAREMVSTIRESGATLMAILNDVLDLSKIEAGRMDVSPIDGRLGETITQIHRLFLPKAAEKGIGLELIHHAAPQERLRFDPVRVRQCVSNLVSNAVKFTREGRVEIDVRTFPAGSRTLVSIRISDSGIGMDAAALGRLFEAFSQADASTTRQFGGTGLGLTISRRLARLMGGDIVAESEAGRGSRFTLTFLADAAQSAPEESSHSSATSGRIARLRGARVLLTDDNAINRQVVRLFLQPQGVQLTEAANGKEALDLLAQRPFDLVLLDVHMPVMDGTEAIRRIRASSEAWRDLPVIALTADAMAGDRERLIAIGMSGYVSKPIDQGELLGEIGRVLGIASSAPPASRTAAASEVSLDDLLGDLDRIANG